MCKLIALVGVLVLVIGASVEGKHYATRCDLVRDLKTHGFPATKMSNWVCLVEAESSRTTSKVNANKNGSKDYGLFQINDRYWCSSGNTPGKDCHVKCSDLLTDDISKASACAKKVFKRHGFNAWYGWKNKCQGALPDVSGC